MPGPETAEAIMTENGHAAQEDVWIEQRDDGLLVSYGFKYPDVSPPGLRSLPAGVISKGMFYPWGSVSRAYFEDQQAFYAQQRAQGKPDVYFIRSERGGPVKIGVATDINARLATLQAAHPYKLLVIATIPKGGYETEKRLHKRFAPYRLSGEWFEWNDQIKEVVHEA